MTNKKIEIINLTPHDINIIGDDNKLIKTFKPSGVVARLKSETVEVGCIDGVRITQTRFGEPEGLPMYEDGVYYIVSAIFKKALPNREDLLIPNESVRDENGRIIGCKSLSN